MKSNVISDCMGSDFGPVDDVAVAFHSAEPGHLAFGELVDGVGKEGAHLVVGEDAEDVLGDEFVFQSVVDEVLCGDAAVQKAADFVHEAFCQARIQPRVDARVAGGAVDQRPYIIGVVGKK